ncbi:hypothetical protein E1B28_003065 [Marasmius oreades]|uniref:Protein kinase domain-containing protein n=1 Tax=Marasmius oreades TaxID=181124 RepID=A0A9P7UN16_9AGAR|nr:uncharacterized protein E1B28_003065 [Marasmius oreades]KAG7085504.1 hypothetical protein E1B28_003065 [Marasmius oreades]
MSSTLFEIGLTVMTEELLVDDVFRIDIRGGRDLENDTLTLARALQIVVDGVESLMKYYNRLQTQVRVLISVSQICHYKCADYLFPEPVCGDAPPSLTFLEKLSPTHVFPNLDVPEGQSTVKPSDFSMCLFRARMQDGTIVMVKFTPRYNVEAHSLLAEAELAPRLLHRTKVVGGWFMIVMEFLPNAQNAFTYLYDHQIQQSKPGHLLPRSVYLDIREALNILHAINLVFGDVRLQNVMVREDKGSVRGCLVDFDWCGVAREARYPVFLTKLRSYDDAGMEAYGKMSIKHDEVLMEEFENFCDAA